MRQSSDHASPIGEFIDAVSRSPAAPTDSELRAMAQTATARPRPLATSAGRRRVRVARSRWMLVAVAAALLVGSGLGFGLAGAFTPSGSATSLVGFGFLPAPGWNVSQTGALDATGIARAVAANVPLDPRDDARGEPEATIRALPPRGVLISTTFAPRGDPGVDAGFPIRQPPLLLADAERVAGNHLELVAGIRGHNALVRIHFGSLEPSAELLAAAQRQLDRLVVAAERVTIFARPTVVGWSPATLFGSVDSGRAGETVTIQRKDCGTDFFRVEGGATTEEGGRWSTRFVPTITTTLRAVWNDVASSEVTVRQRALVSLDKRRSAPGFTVFVKARRSVWRKKVQIQRLDQRLGTWRPVKTLVLTDSGGTFAFAWGRAHFRLSLPKGTQIRAFMPRSQTGPCYVPGASFAIRT